MSEVHDAECAEILSRVYLYLDGELPERDCGQVRQHLDECTPCLRQYGLEEAVKSLVARSCGRETVPAEVRSKVLIRLREVSVTLVQLAPEDEAE